MQIIDYPDHHSHFEIQAKLFNALVSEGINVRGEIKAHKSRLDLVVYDSNDEAVAIIEVKSWFVERDMTTYSTKQTAKYKELFGLPVLVIGKAYRIPALVECIKTLVQS